MDLFHYSSKPICIEDIRSVKQESYHFRIKPVGLWLSVGNAWEDWCKAEEFFLKGLTHKSKVGICHDSVLSISGIDQVHEFFDKYGQSDIGEYLKGGMHFVDWLKVSEDYSGFMIEDYGFYCLMNPDLVGHIWLYGWDCSSGCIWDKSAIKSIDLQ